jgi:hypothetical protein
MNGEDHPKGRLQWGGGRLWGGGEAAGGGRLQGGGGGIDPQESLQDFMRKIFKPHQHGPAVRIRYKFFPPNIMKKRPIRFL